MASCWISARGASRFFCTSLERALSGLTSRPCVQGASWPEGAGGESWVGGGGVVRGVFDVGGGGGGGEGETRVGRGGEVGAGVADGGEGVEGVASVGKDLSDGVHVVGLPQSEALTSDLPFLL